MSLGPTWSHSQAHPPNHGRGWRRKHQGGRAMPAIKHSRYVNPNSRSAPHVSSCTTELARGAKPLIRMQGNQTFLDPPEAGSAQDAKRATERKTMSFSFDKSYWSAGPRDEPGYCSQQTLFNDLGKDLLEHGFAGFNACILACKLLSVPRHRCADQLRLARWANGYDYVSRASPC